METNLFSFAVSSSPQKVHRKTRRPCHSFIRFWTVGIDHFARRCLRIELFSIDPPCLSSQVRRVSHALQPLTAMSAVMFAQSASAYRCVFAFLLCARGTRSHKRSFFVIDRNDGSP